eukprot:6043773-Amphidinium_carterae.2
MQELAYQELGIKSNTFLVGAGIRKAGLPGLGRTHAILAEGEPRISERNAEVSHRDTFSLKEVLGRFMYYSWMFIVMSRTDNEEDETEIPSQLTHPAEPISSHNRRQKQKSR